MGGMSKRKGASGEREAAKALTDTFGCEARRGRQYHGGEESPDVRHTLPNVAVEVKRTEKLRLREALAQATSDAGEKVPVVMHRFNRGPWLWIVPLERVPELVRYIAKFMDEQKPVEH